MTTLALQKLVIAPKKSWEDLSPTNPMVATVTIGLNETIFTTTVSPELMSKLMNVVEGVMKQAALEQVNEFVNAAQVHKQIEGTKVS